MVLTRAFQRPRTGVKIFAVKDKRDWALLLLAATAAPVYAMYYLFSAGGAAATDAAIAGRVDGKSRIAELSKLEAPKIEQGRMTTI